MTIATNTCVICGKQFEFVLSNGNGRRQWCDRTCFDALIKLNRFKNRQRHNERRRVKRLDGRKDRPPPIYAGESYEIFPTVMATCPMCGLEHPVANWTGRGKPRIYCSQHKYVSEHIEYLPCGIPGSVQTGIRPGR